MVLGKTVSFRCEKTGGKGLFVVVALGLSVCLVWLGLVCLFVWLVCLVCLVCFVLFVCLVCLALCFFNRNNEVFWRCLVGFSGNKHVSSVCTEVNTSFFGLGFSVQMRRRNGFPCFSRSTFALRFGGWGVALFFIIWLSEHDLPNQMESAGY